ncbi:MAG: type IV pilus twitching motility protein PilT [Planctomycetota bacterium]|jgi:twitching motility protein PilT
MTESSGKVPKDPCYPTGGQVLSIFDLLARFAEPAYMVDGVSRLSDLHMTVGEPLRYRFDGELVTLPDSFPVTPEILTRLLFPLLDESARELLLADSRSTIDAGFDWQERGMSFRINAFHDRHGLAAAIRVLPREIPALDAIGFPEDEIWRSIIEADQGLVIVTGVTGSGKSTTIASLLQAINRRRGARIITLEDPIEYVLESEKSLISQRELGRHLSSFSDGLRSALREDPDVIFVGEIRDQETASLALSAAETGHLVLTTLHTRDTRGAITRLVDMFPADRTKELCSQLSFAIHTIVGQKLVPKATGGGRRVAMEVLKNIPAMAHLIRSGKWEQIYATLETQRAAGMWTLERHLLQLVEQGRIELEVGLRAANTRSVLTAYSKGRTTPPPVGD